MAYWDVDDVEDIGCLHIIQDMNYRIVLSNVNPNKAPNKGDLFDQAFGWIEIYKNISDKIYLINILSIFIFALSTFYLCASAGHNNKDEEIHINWFDKIPFEITSFAVIMIIGTGIALFADSWIFLLNALLLSIEIIIGMITISIVYLLSIIRKLKAKSFWKYTLVGIIFKWFKKHLGRRIAFVWNQMRENTPAVGKFILLIIAMLMADLIVGVLLAGPFVYVFDGFGIILLGMILLGANLVPFIYAICQMSILQKAAKNIAEGRLDDPIDTSKMYWEFRKHGDYLNRVSDGISAAVSEKMKSERFKTELITNVSHDIKTPLTSIINYVDLIKKEDVSKPPLDEYIQVLDRQSARLKKLIEDLMEASKASTGNLAVNLEKCNVGVFVTQIVGEFEEKLLGKNLELIINKPDEALEIMADGRHFWRVIDNLMNNICKYAQPGTRVYVNIERDNDNVTLTFLNTSAYQLNISSEELMERFVRGDSSRNTEGSGLGLSIASSLTALMEGEMKLDILGDLFKVTLIFKNAK